jgi:hypothetical protein
VKAALEATIVGSVGEYEPGPGACEPPRSFILAVVPKTLVVDLALCASSGTYFPGPGAPSRVLVSSLPPRLHFDEQGYLEDEDNLTFTVWTVILHTVLAAFKHNARQRALNKQLEQDPLIGPDGA